MTIRPGEFWVANIPFTSGGGTKKRPVLVLWRDGPDSVVAAVASSKVRTPLAVALNDWQSSGLRLPSTMRLSRLDCLEQPLFIGRIGMISAEDGKHIKQVWATSIKPQF